MRRATVKLGAAGSENKELIFEVACEAPRGLLAGWFARSRIFVETRSVDDLIAWVGALKS